MEITVDQIRESLVHYHYGYVAWAELPVLAELEKKNPARFDELRIDLEQALDEVDSDFHNAEDGRQQDIWEKKSDRILQDFAEKMYEEIYQKVA